MVHGNGRSLGIEDLSWKFSWTVTQLSYLAFNLDLFYVVSQGLCVHSQPGDKHQGTDSEMGLVGSSFWLSSTSFPGSHLPSHCTEWYLYKAPPAAAVLLRFTLCNVDQRYFHQWMKQTCARTSWLRVIAEQQQNQCLSSSITFLDSSTWSIQCSLGSNISEHGCSFLFSCCKATQWGWVKKEGSRDPALFNAVQCFQIQLISLALGRWGNCRKKIIPPIISPLQLC